LQCTTALLANDPGYSASQFDFVTPSAASRFHSVAEKWYVSSMTKLLDRALEAVRALPPDAQDDIARIVLQLAGNDEPAVTLSPEERAAVTGSKAAAGRGEFATDEQVRSVWDKHSL
jgi:hypothetical protein